MRKIIAAVSLAVIATSVRAELVQQFRDPTFSGNGWATQVLTLEQMRQGAEQQKKAKEEAAIAQAKADAANTPLAKFMALFQTQVYSQISTQLTNSMFSGSGAFTGSINLDSKTTIKWTKLTDAGGTADATHSATQIKLDVTGSPSLVVPISSFAF